MKQSVLARKSPLQSRSELKRSPMKHHRSKRARAREFSPKIRAIVMERSDGMCELCKMRPIAHLHHCQYRSQGGSGELPNCLGVCLVCHKNIHAHSRLREVAVELGQELAKAR